MIENYLVHVTKTDKTKIYWAGSKKRPRDLARLGRFLSLTLAIGLDVLFEPQETVGLHRTGKKRKKTIVTVAGRASRNPALFRGKIRDTCAQRSKSG